jgi:hypothetical protein
METKAQGGGLHDQAAAQGVLGVKVQQPVACAELLGR